MAEGSNKMASMSGDLMANLTTDILTDIISHVPYKSTCCCKCVCKHWHELISHPYHHKKMQQSLIGFYHESYDRNCFPKFACCFTNVSGKGNPLVDPSPSFLPKFCSAPSVSRIVPKSVIRFCAILPL
jgi:hypothetical protein